MREAFALAIFGATLLAVLTRPGRLPEGASAAIGAAAMLATGLASPGDLGAVTRDNLTVLAFFLGMMALTTLAEEAGVFDRMARWAARLAGGSSRHLFFNVFLLGSLISTFLTNDATALILTPVVYALVTQLRLDPVPYVFACTFIADTASMTLPISNPINIILGQRFPTLSLLDSLHYLLLPSLAAICINMALFAALFRRKVRGAFQLRPETPATAADRRALGIAAALLIGTGAAFVIASELRPAAVGVVALAGGGAMVLAAALQGRLRWRTLAGGISWGIFPFLICMFLLVRGIEHQGATLQLGEALSRLAGTGTVRPALVATLLAALGSNLINNVPAVAVLSASIPMVHGGSRQALVYGTLAGCDLGPNLTVVGSLSTMIWLLLLRQRGMEVSGLDNAKYGIIVTPVMLLVSGVLIGVLIG